MKLHTKSLLLLTLLVVSSFWNLNAQVADFKANNFSGCAPLSVSATDLSTGSPVKWLWDFGNGNTSILQNPGFLLSTPGKYTVSLQIWDAANNTSSKSYQFQVFKNPTANFSGAPQTICQGSSVSFSDLSTPGDGTINKWAWDMGNGNVKTTKNPSQVYSTPGKFRVTLAVTDANGCKDNKTIADYVVVNENPVADLKPNLVFSCQTPQQVNFTSTITKGKSAFNYAWNFGDGNTGTGASPSNTYASNGNYTVSLTVTDANGCKGSVTKQNAVNISPIIANFALNNNTKICGPSSVQFLNTTSPNNGLLSYAWDFGDGETSVLQEPAHFYKATGTYDVKLKASVGGCKDEIIKIGYVEILEKPLAKAIITDTFFCLPGSGNYRTDNFTHTLYEWTIADVDNVRKITYNDPVGKFNISTKGVYTSSLTVTGSNGCKNTIKGPNIYYDVPIAQLNPIGDTAGCAPFPFSFSDGSTSILPMTNYWWNWGDKNNKGSSDSAPKNPQNQYTYNDTGMYTITYIVTNLAGCKDTTTQVVMAGLKIKPKDFDVSPKIACPMQNVSGIDKTGKLPVNPHSKKWNIGNDASYNEPPNFYTATRDTGYHDVTLFYYHYGCEDSLTIPKLLYIKPLVAFISINDTFKCAVNTPVVPKLQLFNHTTFTVFYPDKTSTKDTVIPFLLRPGDNTFILIAKNDTMPCTLADTAIIIGPVPLNASTKYTQSNPCVPLTINMEGSCNYLSYLDKIEWRVNGVLVHSVKKPQQGNISEFNYNYQILEPGTYKMEQLYINLAGCIYHATDKTYTVSGPKAKPYLKQQDSCFPMRLDVEDSLFNATDGYKRYWVAGVDTILQTSAKQSISAEALQFDQGSYFITYFVDDGTSCKYNKRHYIKINGSTVPTITADKSYTCSYPSYRFSVVSFDLDPSTIEWYFDGVFSKKGTRINNYQFTSVGPHSCKVIFMGNNGCRYAAEKIVDVDTPILAAFFTADKTAGTCPPLNAQFFNQSKYKTFTTNNFLWTFGDGSTSDLMNPSKIFVLPGDYSVKLKIVDGEGCMDSLELKDFIKIKGPTGTFSFPRSRACVPVNVDFKLTQTNAVKFKWDLADGTLDSTRKNPNHTYTRPGQYIHLVILADSFGCEYAMPVYDTIYAYPHPTASIKSDFLCEKNPIALEVNSTPNYGTSLLYLWNFPDGTTSTDKNPQYNPKTSGVNNIQLIVTNEPGCKDTVNKNLDVPLLKAKYADHKTYSCIGDTMHLNAAVLHDNPLVDYFWTVKNNNYFTKNIVINLDKIGRFDILLAVEDNLGCRDTLFEKDGLLIGDTIPPSVLPMYYVSVLDDQTVELKYAMARNIDFYKYVIYNPDNNPANIWRTINKAEDTMVSINWLNTLRQSYCFKLSNMNGCEKEKPLDSLIKHCTIEVSGKPGKNFSELKWNAYTGWKVGLYEIYRDFADGLQGFTIVGSVSGDSLHFIDSTIHCYTNHAYRIKAYEQNGNQQVSWSDTCHVKPVWENTVLPTKNWRATVENDQFVHLEWEEAPQGKVPVKDYIVYKFNDKNSDYQANSSTFTDLFFKDFATKVNNQSYIYKVKVRDTCNDVSIATMQSKSILLKANFDLEKRRPVLNWNSYDFWEEGIDQYQLQRLQTDGSFTTIATLKNTDSTFTDHNIPINCTPQYTYRVMALRNQPDSGTWHVESISNHAKVLPVSTLFIPNAFTPNKNELNETFGPIGTFINDYQFMIYNRWGEKIFDTQECMKPWDAIYNGQEVPEGVYVYVLYAKGLDGKFYNLKGNVTLLR